MGVLDGKSLVSHLLGHSLSIFYVVALHPLLSENHTGWYYEEQRKRSGPRYSRYSYSTVSEEITISKKSKVSSEIANQEKISWQKISYHECISLYCCCSVGISCDHNVLMIVPCTVEPFYNHVIY